MRAATEDDETKENSSKGHDLPLGTEVHERGGDRDGNPISPPTSLATRWMKSDGDGLV